jgi:hypothetical protein
MPKPTKTPALVKRVAQKAQPKPLTREQLMDIAARKTFAEMDRVNSDRSIEYRIMTEGGGRFEPQPSEKNCVPGGVTIADLNADLTFSRVAGTPFGGSTYMRSRRVG